jgi:hypothetical protein
VTDWVTNPPAWFNDLEDLSRWCLGTEPDEPREVDGVYRFPLLPRAVRVDAEHPNSMNKWRAGWLYYKAWNRVSTTARLEGTLSWRNIESPDGRVEGSPDLWLRITLYRNKEHSWELHGDDVEPEAQYVRPIPALTRFPPDPNQPWDGLWAEVGPFASGNTWGLVFKPSYPRDLDE